MDCLRLPREFPPVLYLHGSDERTPLFHDYSGNELNYARKRLLINICFPSGFSSYLIRSYIRPPHFTATNFIGARFRLVFATSQWRCCGIFRKASRNSRLISVSSFLIAHTDEEGWPSPHYFRKDLKIRTTALVSGVSRHAVSTRTASHFYEHKDSSPIPKLSQIRQN